MELKPGYKQTEVGVIPEEWEVVTATDACELIVDCKNRTPPIVADSDYAVVRTPNVRDGQFVLEDLRFTDEVSYREWTARAVPQFGDIMITREAPLGEVCAVPSGRKVCLGQRMMLYRPSPTKTDSTYLLFSLMSLPVRANLLRKIGGSTVGHAKVDDIRFLQLPLPSLPEQRAIAKALSDVDALLAALDRLIAKQRDLKQATMQQLLTGQTRLPGFTGEWEEKRLGAVCWFQEGPGVRNTQFTASGVKLLNGTNIFRGKINLETTDRFISEQEANGPYAHFLADAGDIVIACSGISVEKFHDKVAVVAASHLPFCMNTSTMRFKPNQEKLVSEYLCQFLMSDEFKKMIGPQATGSAQLNFGPSHIAKISFQLPKPSEQTAIATVLADMAAELTALEQRRDKTRLLKQAMMQELLTGRTRLL